MTMRRRLILGGTVLLAAVFGVIFYFRSMRSKPAFFVIDGEGWSARVSGSEAVIWIPANSTTGFEWSMDSVTGPIDVVMEYQGDGGGAGIFGAGGTEEVTVRGAGEGTSELVLRYSRSWEDKETGRICRFRVDTDKKGNITGITEEEITPEYDGILSKAEMLRDYEYMWETLEENFPLFEAIERNYGVDRREVYGRYREELEALESADLEEFYAFLGRCLGEFKQVGHLGVSSVSVFDIYRNLSRESGEEVSEDTRVYLEEPVERAYTYLKEKTDARKESLANEHGVAEEIQLNDFGGIPIIKISSFYCEDADDVREGTEKLLKCLSECRTSEDIVFDLRGNRGGNTRVWQNMLPYLGKKEISYTTYAACIYGELNKKMIPVDLEYEKEYWSDESSFSKIESWPLDDAADMETLVDGPLEKLSESDLKRCDLLVRTDFTQKFEDEAEWTAEGKLWVLIDEHSASAAMNMAWVFQKAGLAEVVGPESAGFIGGLFLPPSQGNIALPQSGLVVRYQPYYIMNTDGSCSEFGMTPDVIENDIELWLLRMKLRRENEK